MEYLEALKIGLEKANVLPLRKKRRLKYIIHELFVAYRFLFSKNNLFACSLFPDVYLSIFSFRNKKESLLYLLLLRNTPVALLPFLDAWGEVFLNELVSRALVRVDRKEGQIRARMRVVSYGNKLFTTDLFDRSISRMSYLSYDSLFLAEELKKCLHTDDVTELADMCSGVGILGLSAANSVRNVLLADINENALGYAKANALLNRIDNARCVVSNLFSAVNSRFDFIVCNPPFATLPVGDNSRFLDSDGGTHGIALTLAVIGSLEASLCKEGTALILSKAPRVGGSDELLEGIVKLLNNGKWRIEYTYIARSECHEEAKDYCRQQFIESMAMVTILIKRAVDYSLVIKHRFLGNHRYVF